MCKITSMCNKVDVFLNASWRSMLVLYFLVVEYIVFIIVINKREIEKITKKWIRMEK